MPGYNFTYTGFEMKEIVRNVKMEMKKKFSRTITKARSR